MRIWLGLLWLALGCGGVAERSAIPAPQREVLRNVKIEGVLYSGAVADERGIQHLYDVVYRAEGGRDLRVLKNVVDGNAVLPEKMRFARIEYIVVERPRFSSIVVVRTSVFPRDDAT